jgi:hypothetical protein
MPNDAVAKRIDEASADCIGVLTALLHARNTVGEKNLIAFLDRVPEKGEALWLRFKAFQKASRDKGASIEMTFNHFIASIVMPAPFL